MIAPSQPAERRTLARFVRTGHVSVQTGLRPVAPRGPASPADGDLRPGGTGAATSSPRLPELQQVVDDPAVRGALTSILGPTFVAHPTATATSTCRAAPGSACTRTPWTSPGTDGRAPPPALGDRLLLPPGRDPGYGADRHRPGTQYFVDQPNAARFPGDHGARPAGAVTIVHFDIWHRGTANLSDRPRFMVKFEFEADGRSRRGATRLAGRRLRAGSARRRDRRPAPAYT